MIMNEALSMVCYWVGGFFVGYGIGSAMFPRQRKRIINSVIAELKNRNVILVSNPSDRDQ